jgi:hypothetical protein
MYTTGRHDSPGLPELLKVRDFPIKQASKLAFLPNYEAFSTDYLLFSSQFPPYILMCWLEPAPGLT